MQAPGSLTKILTVGTACETLGGDTRFTTRFSSAAPVDADGVLGGDLFIRGGGDPTIGSKKHTSEEFAGNGTVHRPSCGGPATSKRGAGDRKPGA